MTAKVVNVNEVNPIDLFNDQNFILGDTNGKWCVVEDNVVFGQYNSKELALDHADSLNSPQDPEFANLTTKEIIAKATEALEEAEEFLKKIKK